MSTTIKANVTDNNGLTIDNTQAKRLTRKQIATLAAMHLPSIVSDAFFYPDDQEGPGTLSGCVRINPANALELMRLNLWNRPFNWAHASLLATAMRDADSATGWQDDVSTLLVAYDPITDTLFIADGQHRLGADILAFGDFDQVQQLLHIVEVSDHNRFAKPDDRLDPDTVQLGGEYEFIDAEGNLETRDSCSVAEWLAEMGSNPESELAYSLPVKNFEIGSYTRVIQPRFGIVIGVSPKVLTHADQNNLERSGADHLAMSDFGPVIAASGLPFGMAASLLKDLYLRCKTPKIEKSEVTGEDETVRGSLKGGGRFASPAGYPGYWGVLGKRCLEGYKRFESSEIVKKSAFMESTHSAYSHYRRAITAATAPEKPGFKIADKYIVLALTLRQVMSGENIKEVAAECADMGHRLRYGVSIDGNIDDCFASVRDYVKQCAKTRTSPNPDDLIDGIISGWRTAKGATPSAEHPIERFDGLDMIGWSDKDEKTRKGVDPDRKRGGQPKATRKPKKVTN